jgi:hypothetical protein
MRARYFLRRSILVVMYGLTAVALAACANAFSSTKLTYDVPRADGGIDEVKVEVTERYGDERYSGDSEYKGQDITLWVNERKLVHGPEYESYLKRLYIPQVSLAAEAFNTDLSDRFSHPFGDPNLGIRPKS